MVTDLLELQIQIQNIYGSDSKKDPDLKQLWIWIQNMINSKVVDTDLLELEIQIQNIYGSDSKRAPDSTQLWIGIKKTW